MNKCEIFQCEHKPHAIYTWGGFANGSQMNKVPLCKQHADELWDKIRPQVTAGTCYYAIDPLPLEAEHEHSHI